MTCLAFKSDNIDTISNALFIAEEKVGDYYKFSSGQWKRHQYDVKTLESLEKNEITSFAFALLNKCTRVIEGFDSSTKKRDFYFICLQDHLILNALQRDKYLTLLPLLVYIFTHELVHIVRFCNFFQRYEVSGKNRDEEESLVHDTTYKILNRVALKNMGYILDSYKHHRPCELAV
ncbi:MAG: hypothetical protein GX846_06825 [Deltaproteobacteria bacterium]|nr:hypothetical protein [Deltaproteobacteria bacterium]